MAHNDLFGGIQLDPLTDHPTNLDHADIDRSIDKVRQWFFENFEAPEEHTPRDDGEFVYIWGGPWETREIIETIFSDPHFPPEVIEAIIEDIEQSGDAWVPNDHRIQPPDDFEQGYLSARSVLEVNVELRSRIQALELDLALIRRSSIGIGHNHPPEVIDSISDFAADLPEVEAAIDNVKAQSPEPSERSLGELKKSKGVLEAVGTKWKAGLLSLGGAFAIGAAKEAGKDAVHAFMDGQLYHVIVSALEHITQIVELLRESIVSLCPPF